MRLFFLYFLKHIKLYSQSTLFAITMLSVLFLYPYCIIKYKKHIVRIVKIYVDIGFGNGLISTIYYVPLLPTKLRIMHTIKKNVLTEINPSGNLYTSLGNIVSTAKTYISLCFDEEYLRIYFR